MQQKFFSVPFAVSGDQTVVANPTDAGGIVSFTQGWPSKYSLPIEDPASLKIDRERTNYLFNVVTTALGALQAVGVPEWITAADNNSVAFPYASGAHVRYSAIPGTDPWVEYVSLIDANTDTPGATSNWHEALIYSATQSEVLAGILDTRVVTPLSLAGLIPQGLDFGAVTFVSANVTLAASSTGEAVKVTATALTLTLPALSTVEVGQGWLIAFMFGSGNGTIAAASGDNINDPSNTSATSFTGLAMGSYWIISNGTTWDVLVAVRPTFGTVTSVNVSGGSTGLTASGGPITSSGTITFGGTLAVANGGTGGTSASTARAALSAAASGANNDITSLAALTIPMWGSYATQFIVTAATTFNATAIGSAVAVNSSSATANILPAASAIPNGKAITFGNIGAGIATFSRAASDTITGGNLSAATAIPLNQGECVTLVSDGVSKYYVAESNVIFFGAPAVWQDVSGSRAFNTSYTNTSGRTINVVAGCSGFSGVGVITLNVNGLVADVSPSVSGNSFSPTTFGSVPPGVSYSLSQGTGTTPVIWKELR